MALSAVPNITGPILVIRIIYTIIINYYILQQLIYNTIVQATN